MRWGVIAASLLVAACIPKSEAPVREAGKPAVARPDKTALLCQAELRKDEIGFRALPDQSFAGGCSALGAVQLTEIGTPVANLGAMTCPVARQFARWTREAVQPAAQQWLGQPIKRIESMGTYSCRPVNGVAGAKLSEHGRANAVDIGAFVLEDGRRITVAEGWNSEDEDVRRFLRQVHQAGCRRFGVTLGPDANGYHRDHLHFDMGAGGAGAYCR